MNQRKRFFTDKDYYSPLLLNFSWRSINEHICPVTGLSAFSIPAFVFGQQGRECIICHEMSCAIVVYLFSNLEKLSHSSTFSLLAQSLSFQLLLGWDSCALFFLSLILPCQLLQLWKYFWEQSIKWHITFCTVYYFISKYKRDKPFWNKSLLNPLLDM